MLERFPLATPLSVPFDDFEGVVVGHYQTLQGKRGVVLQQNGTRVIHVDGEKCFDREAPPGLSGSSQARLDALEEAAKVAEDGGYIVRSHIAAAIRKLKETGRG